jgi:multiple sugar transport system substrate-binding protein
VARIFGVIPIPPAATATPTPEPVVLHFGHWETGAAANTLADAAREFEQLTPNVIVRADVLPFRAHFDRLQAGAPAGDVPDVFVSSGAYFYRQASDQQLLDLSTRSAADNWRLDEFWTDPVTRPMSGQQLSLPLWASTEVAFVNRDRVAAAGGPTLTDTWSWLDLLDLAKRLTVGKPGEVSHWGLLIVNDIQGGWGSFATSNGGSWLDSATRKSTLGTATAEALRWVSDAMLVHHVAPRPLEQQRLTGAGTIDPFLAGTVSILPNGTWEMASALQSAHFSWDIVHLPRSPRTNQSVSPASSQPGCAARESRYPDLAWSFLRYLVGPDVQRRWTNGKLRIPTLKSATSSYGTAPPANAAAAVAALTNAADLRFTTNWQPFRTAILSALEPALNGLASLDDAIALATQAGDAALGA